MEKYIALLRENICSICADSDEAGECRLSEKEICAVERFLPEIISTIHNTKSESMDDHIAALRGAVCQKCRTKDGDDYCYLREDANCALDRYYPLIVELVLREDRLQQR